MRLSLCVLFLLTAACASTPEPEPEPAALTDRTADTDYRLGAVEDKLRQAERIEYDNGRAAAVLVVSTAQRMLPEGYERERDYLQVIKAGMWARQGKDRDAGKATELLDEVEPRAGLRGDDRLQADIALVRVLLALAEGDVTAGHAAGNTALDRLSSANAYGKRADTAVDLAYQFLEHDVPAARNFAKDAVYTAERLDDDEAVLRARLAMAHVELQAGGNAEKHFREAYEAAYRLNDLGWRNVVISQAVNAWYQRDDYGRVQEWGDRLRDHRMGSLGQLPRLGESGLWEGDYIMLLAQYAFAGGKTTRAREAAALVIETIEELPEGEREQWSELAEKLRSGLLQEPAEK